MQSLTFLPTLSLAHLLTFLGYVIGSQQSYAITRDCHRLANVVSVSLPSRMDRKYITLMMPIIQTRPAYGLPSRFRSFL